MKFNFWPSTVDSAFPSIPDKRKCHASIIRNWSSMSNLSRVITSILAILSFLLVSPIYAAGDGLEFLNVKSIAYVEIKGVVGDSKKSPIAGAQVLAIWTATSYGNHSSNQHCLRIAAAATNANGSFSIAAPSDSVFRRGLVQQFVGKD